MKPYNTDFADRSHMTPRHAGRVGRTRRFLDFLGTGDGLDLITDIGCTVLVLSLCAFFVIQSSNPVALAFLFGGAAFWLLDFVVNVWRFRE